MQDNRLKDNFSNKDDIKKELFRYLSFWPYFLISIIFFLILAFLFLRYTVPVYQTNAKIEIIDKSQDNEMALPTEMTIFNRSMINLENEIGILNSYILHENTVKSEDFNLRFFNIGDIKTSENHKDEWFDDYELKVNVDLKGIIETISFLIFPDENKLVIESYDYKNQKLDTYNFNNLSTFNQNHDLPFNLKINNLTDNNWTRELVFMSLKETAIYFKDIFSVKESGKDSDQLTLSVKHENIKIANLYLNKLIYEFDKDGVTDRQLEYKRTIDFVDSRSIFISKELQQIELEKQKFKEVNNLSDIKSNATESKKQQLSYNSELFDAKSQLDLINLLEQTIIDNSFKLMPVDIGIKEIRINDLVSEYNKIIRERERFLLTAGPKNYLILNLESQLQDFKNVILGSIENFEKTLNKNILNLESKENEYTEIFNSVPENEKILRAIERELEIKESLFLLLLQKREEAAINFAVVKPSIKIIDNAMNSESQIFPKIQLIYLMAFFLGFAIPLSFLFIYFFIDEKIHTKEQFKDLLDDIPLLSEVPFLNSDTIKKGLFSSTSRIPLVESIRLLHSNLTYIIDENIKSGKVILVTSSIKGEGKTLISSNVSNILSDNQKVILIGCDLRNPQIHKLLDVDKDQPGLTNFLKSKNKSYKEFITKKENLDVLLSGSIPPNPNELLSSDKFSNLILQLKKEYDYIIIDSAPCVLVSDSFIISKNIDATIFVFRANFSNKNLIKYINEINLENKFPKFSVVLNGVGNSRSYGYKYGYQYGYKYSYNYGYGYGYD